MGQAVILFVVHGVAHRFPRPAWRFFYSDVILAVQELEYTGEEILEFEGIRYAVTHVYKRDDGLVELTGTKKATHRRLHILNKFFLRHFFCRSNMHLRRNSATASFGMAFF